MDKVSAYIEQQYGDYDLVGHEVASPDIHCDIVIVPPTEENPYYKLVTMGAGAYKMNVPIGFNSTVCNRAEYVIFLPKDWNLESDKKKTSGLSECLKPLHAYQYEQRTGFAMAMMFS